jgi:hypothetical protein
MYKNIHTMHDPSPPLGEIDQQRCCGGSQQIQRTSSRAEVRTQHLIWCRGKNYLEPLVPYFATVAATNKLPQAALMRHYNAGKWQHAILFNCLHHVLWNCLGVVVAGFRNMA